MSNEKNLYLEGPVLNATSIEKFQITQECLKEMSINDLKNKIVFKKFNREKPIGTIEKIWYEKGQVYARVKLKEDISLAACFRAISMNEKKINKAELLSFGLMF